MVPRNQAGFTLVEVLVGFTISAVLLGLLAVTLRQGVMLARTGTARAVVQQVARDALDRVVHDVQYAKKIVINDQSTITLTVDKPGKTGTVVTYHVDSDGILRRNAGGGGQPVTGRNTAVYMTCHWLNKTKQNAVSVDIAVADATNPDILFQLSTAIVGFNVPQ